MQEARSVILQNQQGKHHGQPARGFRRRPGWQQESGVQLRLYQTGCVGSGRCFVLSGSPVSHRSGEGSAVASRLEESWFIGDIKELFGQFLSNKAGRECSREKEPSLPSYTPGVVLCLWAMRKALGALFLSLVNPSF